jgi:hypothetical protein
MAPGITTHYPHGDGRAYNREVSATDIQVRCQRCGTLIDLRDPAPGAPGKPNSFGPAQAASDIWSTYPAPVNGHPDSSAGAKWGVTLYPFGKALNPGDFLTSQVELPTLGPVFKLSVRQGATRA